MIEARITKAADLQDVTIRIVEFDVDKSQYQNQGENLATILWESLPAATWDFMMAEARRLEQELNKEVEAL